MEANGCEWEYGGEGGLEVRLILQLLNSCNF
jgi:hypothetical protein